MLPRANQRRPMIGARARSCRYTIRHRLHQASLQSALRKWTLQKQPITASGKIYHTIAEYQSSGTAAQMIQGASNPNGQLVGIESGEQALFYPLPANPDTGTDPIDSFTFIKNDLIYSVSFDANDPNERAMLESIACNGAYQLLTIAVLTSSKPRSHLSVLAPKV